MPGQCTSDPNLNFTKKEMEFLELRQQLKGYIRDELKKEYAASVCDNSQEKKKLPSNNYGSFFGHSQPSIARRFLQERKTMVEVQQLAAKLMNSHHSNKKSHVSTASKENSGLQECKITAQVLKASRDYSSIFSDQAENLSSTEPAATVLKANQKHPSSCVQRVSFSNPIKMEHVTQRKMNYDQSKMAKLNPNQLQFPKDKALKEHSISMPKLQAITKGGLEQNRKFTEASCNAKVMQKQVKTATRNHHTPDKHKASFPRSSIGEKRKSEEEVELVETKKAKVMQNHPESSVKEMRRKPSKEKVVSAQTKSLSKHQIKHPMQELCHDDEVDDSYISSLCQSLFRRNYTKHVENYDDDDDECMVSNFNDIEKEERKSAKIAREEDRKEQLRLEQEEKKERLRIIAKKQKQHHN